MIRNTGGRVYCVSLKHKEMILLCLAGIQKTDPNVLEIQIKEGGFESPTFDPTAIISITNAQMAKDWHLADRYRVFAAELHFHLLSFSRSMLLN